MTSLVTFLEHKDPDCTGFGWTLTSGWRTTATCSKCGAYHVAAPGREMEMIRAAATEGLRGTLLTLLTRGDSL